MLFKNVDFYEFRFEGKIARMYERQYVKDRARQFEDGKPNNFLDEFRRQMMGPAFLKTAPKKERAELQPTSGSLAPSGGSIENGTPPAVAQICPKCDGSGEASNPSYVCPLCRGSGKLQATT